MEMISKANHCPILSFDYCQASGYKLYTDLSDTVKKHCMIINEVKVGKRKNSEEKALD